MIYDALTAIVVVAALFAVLSYLGGPTGEVDDDHR